LFFVVMRREASTLVEAAGALKARFRRTDFKKLPLPVGSERICCAPSSGPSDDKIL
jgi:hypothetical protein